MSCQMKACVDVKKKKKQIAQMCIFPTVPEPKDEWRKYHFFSLPHHTENIIPQKATCWKGVTVWKKGAVTEILSQL